MYFRCLVSIAIVVSVFSCRKDKVIPNVEPSFKVFPTPFIHEFFIDANSVKEYKLTIYDMQGYLKYSKSHLQSGFTTINFDAFESGVYLLRIEFDEFNVNHKILKQ